METTDSPITPITPITPSSSGANWLSQSDSITSPQLSLAPYKPSQSWLEYYKKAKPEFWNRKQFTLLEEHRSLILQCMIDEKWDMHAGLQATVEKFMEEKALSPIPDADDTDGRKGWERMRDSITNRVRNNQQQLANLGYVVKKDVKREVLWEGDDNGDSSKKRKRSRYGRHGQWKWVDTDEEQKAWLRQTLLGLNYSTEDKWRGFMDIAVEVFGPGFVDVAKSHLNSPNVNFSGSLTSTPKSNTGEGDDHRMNVTDRLDDVLKPEAQEKDLDARGPLASLTTPEPQSSTRFPLIDAFLANANFLNSPLAFVGRADKRVSRKPSVCEASTQTKAEAERTEPCSNQCNLIIQTKNVYKLAYRASFRHEEDQGNLTVNSIVQNSYFHELENANLHLWQEWNRMGLDNSGIGRGQHGHLIGNYIGSGNGIEKTHKMEITVERVRLLRRMGQKASKEADTLTAIRFDDVEAPRVELPTLP